MKFLQFAIPSSVFKSQTVLGQVDGRTSPQDAPEKFIPSTDAYARRIVTDRPIVQSRWGPGILTTEEKLRAGPVSQSFLTY